MPATVSVPALKPLTYQGRSYVRGELVIASPIDAAAMARRGEVSLTRGAVIAPTPDLEHQAMEPEPAAGRRRRYRRRDMTADEPA